MVLQLPLQMKTCTVNSDTSGMDAVKLVSSRNDDECIDKSIVQRDEPHSEISRKRSNDVGSLSVTDASKPMCYGGSFGMKLMSGKKAVALFPTSTKIVGFLPGYVPPRTGEVSDNSSDSESEDPEIAHTMLLKRAKLLCKDHDGVKAKRVTLFN
uniref:Uncharacterized protein n=1 Tax=Trichuris muris TaxID=70415 RepID=A0A5S6QEG3_TRIMR